MRIADVRAECFRVPVKLPRLDDDFVRPLVIVTVETDNGLIGHGLTAGTPLMIASIREFLNLEVGPYVRGMDPVRTEQIWSAVQRKFNRRNLSGVWSSGVSGLDIALWDIKGKYFDKPVAELLGGAFERAPAYITFGVNEYTVEESAEVAKELVEQGYTRLKMVVGEPAREEKDMAFWGSAPARAFSSDLLRDEQRIRAVREAVGESVELMIDANYMLTAAEAKRLCRRVEDCDIAWFEEPVWNNDPLELAGVRSHTSTPIGAGQNFGNQWPYRDLLLAGAVDIVMPNVCYGGGYTEGLKIAHLARAFNKPIANGAGWPQHNLHLHAAVSNGGPVEFHWSAWKAVDALFRDAPNPEGPWVRVPDAPGVGFLPDDAAMQEYRTEH